MEEIPCNPCETVCPKGAIIVGKPIANLPRIEEDKCNGCGLCIPVCPGMAIFNVDNTYSENRAIISLPYEYLPLPTKGLTVDGVDRKGEVVCKAKVIRVSSSPKYDHTSVISIATPKRYSSKVRGIKLGRDYKGVKLKR